MYFFYLKSFFNNLNQKRFVCLKTPPMPVKETKQEHLCFMTEKEKAFVRGIHVRNINKNIYANCFEALLGQNQLPLTVYKKEKTHDENLKEKITFTAVNCRSRKKMRIVHSKNNKNGDFLNQQIAIEDFIKAVLKIKYNYSEIVVEDDESSNEYRPVVVNRNNEYKNETVAFEMFKKINTNGKIVKKLFDILYDLCVVVSEERKTYAFALVYNKIIRADYNKEFQIFIDSMIKITPPLKENELEFEYFDNISCLLVAIVLMLKCDGIVTNIFDKVKNKIDDIFGFNNDKVVWQFFSIMIARLDNKDKKELFIRLNDHMKEAISDKNETVNIFMKTIGMS